MLFHLQLSQCVAFSDIPIAWFTPEVQAMCAPIREATAPAEPSDPRTIIPM